MITNIFFALIGSLIGRGFWPHARERGAILIYGDWQGQRGVESDEAGISVSNFDVAYRPFVNDRLLDNAGEPRARAVSDQFSREVTIQGEQLFPASGLMLVDLGVKVTVANDIDDFGDGSGDLLLDEVTVTQERAGWRRINMRLSSDPGVVETTGFASGQISDESGDIVEREPSDRQKTAMAAMEEAEQANAEARKTSGKKKRKK